MISIKLSKTTIDGTEFRATMPTRGSAGAAGYDVSAYLPTGKFKVQIPRQDGYWLNGVYVKSFADPAEAVEMLDHIPPGARALIPTGVALAIDEMGSDVYARIAPRSGLAWKNGQAVMAGVWDGDFRDGAGVILHNTSSLPVYIKHGDRIAQIIFERIAHPHLRLIEGELPATVRGAGGYGSTGTGAVPCDELANFAHILMERPLRHVLAPPSTPETVDVIDQMATMAARIAKQEAQTTRLLQIIDVMEKRAAKPDDVTDDEPDIDTTHSVIHSSEVLDTHRANMRALQQ